jgi:predicted Rossmann fold flavoprotein
MSKFDVIVIGAGAAGMFCAAEAARRGRRVLLIDHAQEIGTRIRISGGGRCNFTNRSVGAENFLSQNPHFCRSALARFSSRDFVALLEQNGIAYHERKHGQLFCDESAQDIITMLKSRCTESGVKWAHPCHVGQVEARQGGPGYALQTSHGSFGCESLVIATGGLAIPKLGASPFGYQVAQQFALEMVAPQPALVPLVLATEVLTHLQPLSGASLDASLSCSTFSKVRFRNDMLLTHRGLSGPAILQISSYWQMQEYHSGKKQPIAIDLLPDIDAGAWLSERRRNKLPLAKVLGELLPRRFSEEWCGLFGWHKPLDQMSQRELEQAGAALKSWVLMPSGTRGYAKAEVTLGGVNTAALSSQTMEVRQSPGLYFIGEVVDVTGWLGGYNFQWAWSSGWVAGQYV